MTDQKLDQMLRRALLDAAAQEAEALPQEPPELSPRHGRSMRAMLRDPLAWARSRRRPALRTAVRHAAAVLLVLVLSAAVLVTVSPQVQADITRWVAEQTGNVLDFQFRGDSPAQPIPQYQITALPEGYVETERTDALDAGNVTHKKFRWRYDPPRLCIHARRRTSQDYTERYRHHVGYPGIRHAGKIDPLNRGEKF